MADTWQTVEQAAVALGMSVRTVNRHIAAGKIASRLEEGRREVLVSLPDPETRRTQGRRARSLRPTERGGGVGVDRRGIRRQT